MQGLRFEKTKVLFYASNLIAFLFALVGIFQLYPSFIWGSGVFIKIAILLPLSLLVLVFFIYNPKVKTSKFFIFVITVSMFFFFQLFNFHISNVYILVVGLFILMSSGVQKNTFSIFYNLFVYTVIPGLFLYVFIFLGVDVPWSQIESDNPVKSLAGHYYRDYMFMVVLNTQIYPTEMGEMFRFSAIYNEPGVVGTVSALLLAATNFRLSSWKSKALLLSGILSFSLAFFAIIGIYLLLRQPKKILIILTMIIFLFLLFDKHIQENKLINAYVLDRLSLVINDTGSANNRSSDAFNQHYSEFLSSDSVLVGRGLSAVRELQLGVSVYNILIYEYGVIGFFLICLMYFLILYVKSKNFLLLFLLSLPFLIVFSLSIYQRPAALSVWMLIIFIGAILHLKQELNCNPSKNKRA